LRLLGRILLWTFAFIGVCISLLPVGIFLLDFSGPTGDIFDHTRVVAVFPAPDDKQAAVVYLHHHSNLSVDLVAVKLVPPPFPAPGTPVRRFGDVITVTGNGSRVGL
jgi:hypothetical protein